LAKEFWVFSEKPALLAELTVNALELSKAEGAIVAAVVIGNQQAIDQAFALGAQKVYALGEKSEDVIYDDYVPTFVSLVKSKQPALIIIGATRQGKAIAGRISAALDLSAITDAKYFDQSSGSLEITHLVFGGGAIRTEKANTATAILTQGAGIVDAPQPTPGASGEVEQVAFVQPAWKISLTERKQKPPASVNLAVAKKVVCAGRGIAKKEDLAIVFELAELLGGEVAATRPLTEGLDWLPRERYIGVSGATIKPDLYISLGVSGQAQHTVGITDSRVIVAIDKDKDAPIFSQADYGIVGDLYQVAPALIAALKARK